MSQTYILFRVLVFFLELVNIKLICLCVFIIHIFTIEVPIYLIIYMFHYSKQINNKSFSLRLKFPVKMRQRDRP